MLLPYTFNISKGTTEPTELVCEKNLAEGILKAITMDIPSGWAYSCGVKLKFKATGSSFTVPNKSVADEYITGDNTYIHAELYKPLWNHDLSIIGINNDSDNDHKGVVFLEILTVEELSIKKYLEDKLI